MPVPAVFMHFIQDIWGPVGASGGHGKIAGAFFKHGQLFFAIETDQESGHGFIGNQVAFVEKIGNVSTLMMNQRLT
jgi:hypothetical protein